MRFLLLNQCFYPDVVSTAQHLSDLARGLTERGHDVTVLSADRGYDNPAIRFPRRETWNGITIIRIPSLSLGKQTKLRRALNFGSFLFLSTVRLLSLRRFDVVVALTSPPLISFIAALYVSLRGGRFCFWVMDLNPDEAIAAGWLREKSVVAQLLSWMLNHSLEKADRIIALDRFMKERILAKGIEPTRISVLPPWSHDDKVRFSPEGRHWFRAQHDLDNKFVVMYSGNHSPCHPLDTLLETALALGSREEISFCFIGGGTEKRKVTEFAERNHLRNIQCFPYQPLDQLSASLSAADLHVVVMGNEFVGIVHPCKIYNISTIGTSTLYIGPDESHVTDIARQFGANRILVAQHGDTASVVRQIEEAVRLKQREVSNRSITAAFSKEVLLPEMIRLIEFRAFSEIQLEKEHGSNESIQSASQRLGSLRSEEESKAQEAVSL